MFRRGWKDVLRALTGVLVALITCTGPAVAQMKLDSARTSADKLLVVDCLLPAEVRNLGTRMTYIAPRRAVKTSIADCEVRGGEYVARVGGTFPTALAIWLPQAERGDKEAQTYVGELYERGLGSTAPDYAVAATWYRKAADQGFARAMMDLGFLYEKGLGVPKDPTMALNLYRKASGLEGLITVDQSNAVAAARDAEIEQLRRELAEARAALDNARKELERRKGEAASQVEQLEREKRTAAEAGNLALVARLESQLKAREDELNEQRQAVARLEQAAARYREQLAGAATESAALRDELDQMQRQQRASAQDLDARRQKAIELERTLEATRQELASARSQQSTTTAQDARIRTLEAQLQARTDDLARQSREIARVEQEAKTYKDQVTALQSRIREALERSAHTSLGPGTRIQPKLDTALQKLEFGSYYALVIGNQKYEKLPNLDTAVEDARAVADVLQNRYGFKVTPLENATRYQILSELNRLRAQLTEKDNLLIYYAGHGELDRANLRGQWLPVDAEPDSDANWISNVTITDILNAMSVRHALVVADSCYSGALSRSGVGPLQAGMADETRVTWIKARIKARSRTVLSSGGLAPVIDGGGGKHSVFAQSFLTVLQENQDVLEADRLHREVAPLVLEKAKQLGVDQKPEYAHLRFAGDEDGDFLFVPKAVLRTAER